MSIYAGIDCGTQSTKVILIETKSNKILGIGSASQDLISHSNGLREQDPKWWIDALKQAFSLAIKNTGIDPQQISALSVSGQQHGLVSLDKNGDVLYPAKLWCDTQTAPENDEILSSIGGNDNCIAELGLVVATGYTASKILWLKKNHPKLWQQLDCILLPHDYINFWLTGRKVMEYGDASGTGIFDTKSRTWSSKLVSCIDYSGILANALPEIIDSTTIVGNPTPEICSLLGLSPKTLIISGSGDNMMGAIGTGNIKPGIVTMSLGTSGTLFSYIDKPFNQSSEMIANFCSANNGWLPLICTMNVTSATSLLQNVFKYDLTQFNQALENSPIGSQGVQILPFFNGERIPPLPTAKASIHGLDLDNFSLDNICRATVEAITYGLCYGLNLMRKQGLVVDQIRLIGGGSKSHIWRQIIADITNCELICLTNAEAAALGAALQAAWVDEIKNLKLDRLQQQNHLEKLCSNFVNFDKESLTKPISNNVKQYEKYYKQYCSLLKKQYPEVEV